MVRAALALRAALGAALVALFVAQAQGESLTPPYFNLAEGKRITASATCGEGLQGPEMYCKLIGTNGDNDLTENVIQGQYCDYCDPDKFDKRHPPEYAVDGMETWWQSPPLSRGMKYNEVNLTIELGQEFHVAYVYIKMAISPRPGLWVLEKSADYGKTYTPWQYFSDSPADCETFFGRDSLAPITRDDSVICTTEYSKIVPLEGGEIPISLLKNRPSANHYFNSTILQEWTRATTVRLRLLRTKNLLGHLMSVARQDPTVTRRYFYAIKDISIGGRCMCNGHAEACDIPDPRDSKILLCHCQHNTCGAKCEQCCPGFEQKAWRQSKHDAPFSCEPCNCFDHSYECEYDPEIDRKHLSLDIHGKYEGGGVCKNCQHNTEGINCNKCKPTFYKPYQKHWNETDVCQPCNCNTYYSTGNCAEGSGRCECKPAYTPPSCDSCSFGYYGYPDCRPCECYLNGTLNQQCTAQEGLCECLPNFGGDYCKECAPGYFNFSECTRCHCDLQGSVSEICDQTTGACTCKNKYAGLKCNECRDGYFFSGGDCSYCNCDRSGTEDGICDKQTGKCICKPGYGGERCDMCILSYYGHPDCKPCNCSKVGSHGTTCSASGKCSCLNNYAGRTCEQCSPGYYNYPECKPCDCDSHGSLGISCDLEGRCECKENFAGNKCDACKEGYYNFPACEDCNCHPAGVVAGFAGCGSVPAGELCQCKERVEGRICDRCKPLYWNLNVNNPQGCEECQCDLRGTLGGLATCDTEEGKCTCKPSVVARRCSECADGTYGLMESDLFGCTDCGCDVGGSLSSMCNKLSGQCQCQSRVTGRTCKEPLQAHYFPTLYHYQYEAEKGRTPENNRVRLSYDETVFPNFSWKGYATFSVLQKEIIQDIYIDKPSLYRMVLRFVNRNPHTVIGGVRVIPDNPSDIEQYHKVQLRNTSKPAFVTLSGETGNTPKPFVMNPGRWSVSITVSENIFLDYFVLLPEDFYLATILNQKVEKPCKVDEMDLCRHYAYPTITGYSRSWGVGGFIPGPNNDQIQLREWFPSQEHLQKIQAYNRVPLLNSRQPEISFNITVPKPGPYVLVVNYVTPLDDLRTHNISVRTQTRNGEEVGQLKFYACPYTTMCRQVVADTFNGVGVYAVDGNNILLTMNGINTNVGVHSVYAIPYDEWSMDQIRPKPVCVHKNGTCIPSTFHNPPETKKIQFEDEMEGELAKNRPPIFVDNETTYLWLNTTDNTVDLKGKVPTPGYYSFILHYRQPHHPEFELDVIIQNGQFYEAKVPVPHCPSESGCRAVVTEANRNDKFSLTENFWITVKQPSNRSVLLDYLLVVPADLYDPRSLEEEDLDRTGEFINTCGNNHFYIDTNETGFCRDAIFSITTNHKNGALPCECDFAGSDSFVCEKFGGQCKCKENIIGRRCEACKTGYYGFPECKPCNCPSTAYCEPNTGECICPPHVVGEKCDQCEPLTYGFDPFNGCEECRCNPLGVANNTRQCNMLTGDCPCQENIFGRTCDHCKPGYYSFPYCSSCGCNETGTTSEICDKVTAQCFCKKNVVGPQCSICHESTFNLQPKNEEGCTECFCFGKSKRCVSSNYIKVSLNVMKDWKMVSLNASERLNVTNLNLTTEDIDDISDVIGVDFSYYNVSQAPAYFAAPPDYLGKKLTSYGGFLNYTIYYATGRKGSVVVAPDVILQGPDYHLTYSSLEQPPSAIKFPFMLQLVESNFELPSGSPAKREHMMEVLKDLRGVYLRATYWTDSVTTRLIDVLEDEAIPPDPGYENGVPALSVEQCMCPPNYQGLSCEECASGYYRVQGPHGGYCILCECHGHATECDVNTGVCLNCKHNTKGDHCEICDEGYHGNAKAGTPRDCLICACPLPIASNNFAVGCQVSADGEKISCDCKEGYIGARCQSCDAGFHGRPESQGDFCRPCQCSGNIDPRDPSSCDTVTGECLRCLNNTFGTACSLCAPGFFGDAVHLKDCQACICDETGTDHCDSYTGRCVCKRNVVGEKCDRCEAHHYGFHSGLGCVECDCSAASESEQCEDATGQCKCKPGAAGRACDRCAAGYWNYTSDGCQSCGCKSEYSLGFGCNAQTGQCECLSGVVGEKCDQCPYRWAFVPEVGCHACDSCHHALLNDTDELAAMIDPVIFEFDSTQSGFFTRRRLANMREQLENLTSKLKDVDPKQVSFDETIQELESLEQDTKNLNRKSNYSLENSEQLKNKSEELKDILEILLDDINTIEDVAMMTIDDINTITIQLTEETGKEIDNALQEGQGYLNQIKGYNLTGRQVDADKTLDKVEDVLRNVTEYKLPVEELQEKVDEIKGNLMNIDDKLDDLFNHSQYSLNMAREAENIIAKSGKDRLKGKLSNIENQVKQSGINLDKSEELLSNASKLLDISIGKLKELQDAPETLEGMNKKFEMELESNRKKIDEIQVLKPKVQEHAQNLSERVQQLEHILSESQYGSQDAVKAARAYKDIVAAVNRAREAADSAKNDSSNAAEILANVHERTNDAENNAATALEDAHDSATMVNQKLKPKLNESVEKYIPVKEAHKKNEDLLNEIEKMLKNIQIKDLNTAYKNASDTADAASDTISHVEPAVNNLFNKLSQETQQAKQLPKELNDMERNLKQTEKQLNTVNETLPSVIQSLEEIPKKQADNKRTSNNIQSNINKLNQQIELARDIANRIKVGVKFYPNTTLELRNPKNIEDLTTATKFSGYFKTSKPNGLLFYIGNPQGTSLPKTKTDDFMALIIQNGYPVLKMDIGNGVQKIINEKYVADDNWYQYIVERVGHNAKLTIREELPDRTVQNYVKETALSGPYTIFNLDKDKSKIFVGGYPSKYDAQLQDQVDMDSFQGEIEDVVIGNTPVSLWNFADGYENTHGAKERNKLVVLSPSTGFRFNGNGYAISEARSISFRIKSAIELSFKTFAPTGLLFLAGKGNTFISIELQNGKVLYQYNLGGATKRWVSSATYNDGQWHKIVAERDGARGRLQVDDENVTDRTKPITGSSLDIIDTMSFGGYPEMHKYGDVTNTRFDGCITNVTIMKTPIDLRASIRAFDVTPGCPDKFAPMVSFEQRQQGYISWDRISIQNRFNASLKFKTMEPDGMIFYVRDLSEDNGISLSLRDGYLVLISQKIELVSKDTFNDGQWHVVSVIHDDTILRLDTDDNAFKVTDHPPPSIHVLYSTLHVGGLSTQPAPLRVGSSVPFRGCIADLTIMGRVMNFANTTDRSYAVLDKCILDHDVSVEVPVPTLKPVKPLQAVTTQSPVYITVNPEEAAKAGRGDGGNDFLRTSTEGARGMPPPTTAAPEIRRPVGTVPITTPRPKLEGCALPLDSKRENEKEVGYRLGTQRYSRLKFATPRGKYKKKFDFRLEFKTRESDGILFYASNRDHSHYAAVYLDEGKMVFTFKGQEAVIIKSRFIYNDDIWHIVEFDKDLAYGKLVIDKEVAEGIAQKAVLLELHVPFYMGGVDPDEYNLVQANLNTTSSFMGCIRGIQMNSFHFEPSETFGVIPCSENVELGSYFAGELSTYVKLKDKFKVGEVFMLKMDIKPRVISGVLVAAHGKKDYYVLELHNGHLQLTVENGRGPVTASFRANSPDHKYHLCDGQWHSIQAVKSKNVITLSVDSMFTKPEVGPPHSMSTDTGTALFLGGHRLIKKVRGIQSRKPYVGCVRNVTINDERVDLTTLPSTSISGNVDIGYCPTN